MSPRAAQAPVFICMARLRSRLTSRSQKPEARSTVPSELPPTATIIATSNVRSRTCSRSGHNSGTSYMISRLIIAAAITLLFAPAALVCAQEHPEHPKKGAEHPKKAGAEKQVSTADISAGIKKNIDVQSKKNTDSKFHVNYQGQD